MIRNCSTRIINNSLFKTNLFRMSSSNSGDIIREIEGDLFTADKTVSLAHCVASDLKMGAGIAVAFKNTFGQVDKLKEQNVKAGGVAVLEDDKRFIYYLITKPGTYQKPTYDSLTSSLAAMKDHMRKHKVKQLAIPRIGCGLDGLQWDKVKERLNLVFEDADVEITVYNFKR